MYHRPIIHRATYRRQLKSATRPYCRSSVSKIWLLLGVGLVSLYVMRVSVLSLWAGPFMPILQRGGQGLLIISVVFFIAKGVGAFSVPGLMFIALTLPGVLVSENIFQSMSKWVAWAALFTLVGPVIESGKARVFRRASWDTFRWMFVSLSFASFGWYAFGLPNLGRGAFTGVMMHSMLLGPITAIASLFLAHRAILARSRKYLLLSLLVIVPCLLAGSRSALLGLAAGVLIMVVFSVGRDGLNKSIPVLLMAGTFVIFGIVYFEEVKDENFLYQYTLELEKKGLNNSREGLWSARLSEFKESPLVGIGVGMGDINVSTKEWRGVVVDTSGNINVEPGSSYLAILSMTGILGAIGLCLVLKRIFRRLRVSKKIQMFDPELFEVLAICAFFAVHLAAEGYIFAVGNQFCLLFWLCLGRVHDIVLTRGNMNSSADFRYGQ